MMAALEFDGAPPGFGPKPGSSGPDDPVEIRQIAPGFVVSALHGLGDRALVTAAADQMGGLALSEHVMVDLSGLTLVDPAVIRVLVRALERSTTDFCLLCDRLVGRLLLERSGASEDVPIFATPDDALQAQVYPREGLGDGWRWQSPRPPAYVGGYE